MKREPKVTDLQLWVMVHIKHLRFVRPWEGAYFFKHVIHKRDVGSVTRTLRKRGWVKRIHSSPQLTEEGQRVVWNSAPAEYWGQSPDASTH